MRVCSILPMLEHSMMTTNIRKELFRNGIRLFSIYSEPLHHAERSTDFDPDKESHSQKKPKAHEYQKRWQFKDVPSTSAYLLDQVIYHEDGLVVLNKPSNLGSSSGNDSIYSSLPYLRKNLGYKDLFVAFVPEKSVSGVTILAADNQIVKAVKKALIRSKYWFTSDPKQTFLAVTVGHPLLQDDKKRYAICKQFHGDKKHCMILRDWHENARKRREVNPGMISHRILAKVESSSLVSVSTWLSRNHCPRVFLSDILLSPALGDQMFGPRVGSLFGKPIIIPPWNAPASQALPSTLLQRLSLRSGSESLIPLHLHLSELRLRQFGPSKKLDLVLRAKPPDYFQWTCRQLNLALPDVQESTKVPAEPIEEESDQQYCQSFTTN